MKISKSLLQAIALGATLGIAATSCSLLEDEIKITPNTTDETCETENKGRNDNHTYHWDNCTACGLGSS